MSSGKAEETAAAFFLARYYAALSTDNAGGRDSSTAAGKTVKSFVISRRSSCRRGDAEAKINPITVRPSDRSAVPYRYGCFR